jgi:hypothetical protein
VCGKRATKENKENKTRKKDLTLDALGDTGGIFNGREVAAMECHFWMQRHHLIRNGSRGECLVFWV